MRAFPAAAWEAFWTPLLNERMLSILSTKENVNLTTLGFDGAEEQEFSAIVTPIEIAGERLGTLFLYRREKSYSIDDIILCEYGATVVGLEMLRAVNEESAEEEEDRSRTRCPRHAVLFRAGSDRADI